MVALPAWRWFALLHVGCSRNNVPCSASGWILCPNTLTICCVILPPASPQYKEKKGLYPEICDCSSVMGDEFSKGGCVQFSFELPPSATSNKNWAKSHAWMPTPVPRCIWCLLISLLSWVWCWWELHWVMVGLLIALGGGGIAAASVKS